MAKPKGKPRAREIRSQLSQLQNHPHGNEKGVKWPMAVKDGSRQDYGSKMDTGLKGTNDELLAVQRQLDADENLSAYGLKVSSANAKIQITGIVDTLADKETLKPLLRDLGIEEFIDGVSISTDGPVLDQHVVREVREEIEAVPLLADNPIDVDCVAGTVFLAGEVASPDEEQAALAAASRARGVVQVVSQLRFLPEERE